MPTARDTGSTSLVTHYESNLFLNANEPTAFSNADLLLTKAYYNQYGMNSYAYTYSGYSTNQDSAALPPPSTVQRSIPLSPLCPSGFPGHTHQTAFSHALPLHPQVALCYS